ncbi:hypothetical protein NBRC116494_08400 [Aurantivibrio plasticivorans]
MHMKRTKVAPTLIGLVLVCSLSPLALSLTSTSDLGLPDTTSAQKEPQALSKPPGAQEPTSSRLSYSQHLENYHIEIERLEAEAGPWSADLAEQLSGLGEIYQERGQHHEAIAIFERAAHVARVNNGLYSLVQAPIVENLIESLSARGQWDDVYDRQQYLYWLHQRSYGEDDPRMLPLLSKMGKWYINDYAMNAEERDPASLIDAHNIFTNATRIIRKEYGEHDLRMIEPLRGLALTHWYFAAYNAQIVAEVNATRYSSQFGISGIDASYESYLRSRTNTATISLNDTRVPPQLRRYITSPYPYIGGKDAIVKMMEIYSTNPNAPVGAAAKAKMELADWQLMWDKFHSAKALYHDAYALMADEVDNQELTNRFFHNPTALPAISLLESQLDTEVASDATPTANDPESELLHFVLVQYDVSTYGDARNIEFLESFPADNSSNRVRVRRALEATRFRPRIVNGEPVVSKKVVQKFVFPAR